MLADASVADPVLSAPALSAASLANISPSDVLFRDASIRDAWLADPQLAGGGQSGARLAVADSFLFRMRCRNRYMLIRSRSTTGSGGGTPPRRHGRNAHGRADRPGSARSPPVARARAPAAPAYGSPHAAASLASARTAPSRRPPPP